MIEGWQLPGPAYVPSTRRYEMTIADHERVSGSGDLRVGMERLVARPLCPHPHDQTEDDVVVVVVVVDVVEERGRLQSSRHGDQSGPQVDRRDGTHHTHDDDGGLGRHPRFRFRFRF